MLLMSVTKHNCHFRLKHPLPEMAIFYSVDRTDVFSNLVYIFANSVYFHDICEMLKLAKER